MREQEKEKGNEGTDGWSRRLTLSYASVGCEGRRPGIARIPSRSRRAVERHEFHAIM